MQNAEISHGGRQLCSLTPCKREDSLRQALSWLKGGDLQCILSKTYRRYVYLLVEASPEALGHLLHRGGSDQPST